MGIYAWCSQIGHMEDRCWKEISPKSPLSSYNVRPFKKLIYIYIQHLHTHTITSITNITTCTFYI